MKKYTLIILFFFSFQSYTQIVKIGDSVPNYSFDKVLNHSSPTLNLHQQKGKILIIEFWGTWCGPCIPALEHLDGLQKKYKNDITVVGISDDTEERLNKFLLKRPVSIPLISDPFNKNSKFFKIEGVPVTYVVDRTGKILAITSPNDISEEKIEKLIRDEKVSLTYNDGRTFSSADPFGADLKTTYSFTIKPKIDTIPGTIYKVHSQGVFKDRRLSFINVTTDFFIKKVFQKTNHHTIFLTDKHKFDYTPENLSCFDIIVPEEEKDNLFKIAQEEILKRLKYKIYLEQKNIEVFVLKNSTNLKLTKSAQAIPHTSYSYGKKPRISAESTPISELVDFLQDQLKTIIIDETGLNEKYDYTIDWQNHQELLSELQKIGLTLEKSNRVVEMLIIADK